MERNMLRTLLGAGGLALALMQPGAGRAVAESLPGQPNQLSQLGQINQPGLPPRNPHYPWQRSYAAVIDQTAAIVAGIVTSVEETYNEREGPRTLVTLSSIAVLWGNFDAPAVTLRPFGGTVPGRRGRVDETHIPTFVQGSRYVVFLSNRDWRLSPVTARQAYLVERVHDKDLVVTLDGHAVFGIDDVEGPRRSFAVYRIPDEVDDNFVPEVDAGVTPDMLRRAYSVREFAEALRTWGSRQGVAVHGAFNDRPYTTGDWRFFATVPERSAAGAVVAGAAPKMFGPPAGRGTSPVREMSPARESRACGGDPATPLDRDPGDRSAACDNGGVR
jgi:hypothetical protein